MNKIVFFVVAVLIFGGCASATVGDKSSQVYDADENVFAEAMIELGDEYLKADELSADKMKQAGKAFKYDILGANKPVIDKKQAKEAIFKAKKTLLGSEQKADYILKSARIDKDFGMPDTKEYIFVHFDPVKDKPEISETTYLVVINRFYDMVFYSGIYSQTPGDPFYKYADVLKEIRK